MHETQVHEVNELMEDMEGDLQALQAENTELKQIIAEMKAKVRQINGKFFTSWTNRYKH